jgi:hypothetical protein
LLLDLLDVGDPVGEAVEVEVEAVSSRSIRYLSLAIG